MTDREQRLERLRVDPFYREAVLTDLDAVRAANQAERDRDEYQRLWHRDAERYKQAVGALRKIAAPNYAARDQEARDMAAIARKALAALGERR